MGICSNQKCIYSVQKKSMVSRTERICDFYNYKAYKNIETQNHRNLVIIYE